MSSFILALCLCLTSAQLLAPNLRTAGNYTILSKTGISSVPGSAIVGNIACSPIAANAITGFSLTDDASGVFSRSSQVSGLVYAADYADPTPATLTSAIGDMETAYEDCASRSPNYTELATGSLGGLTLYPGVYYWSSNVNIATQLYLSGSAVDVFIFQVAGDVSLSTSTRITLTNGAVAKNVFWQVAGEVDVFANAHFEGVVLSKTAIHLKTGATLTGRLLAQTAVTLDQNAVTESN